MGAGAQICNSTRRPASWPPASSARCSGCHKPAGNSSWSWVGPKGRGPCAVKRFFVCVCCGGVGQRWCCEPNTQCLCLCFSLQSHIGPPRVIELHARGSKHEEVAFKCTIHRRSREGIFTVTCGWKSDRDAESSGESRSAAYSGGPRAPALHEIPRDQTGRHPHRLVRLPARSPSRTAYTPVLDLNV